MGVAATELDGLIETVGIAGRCSTSGWATAVACFCGLLLIFEAGATGLLDMTGVALTTGVFTGVFGTELTVWATAVLAEIPSAIKDRIPMFFICV